MQGFAYFPAIIYRDERPDLVEKPLEICNGFFENIKHNWPIKQTENFFNDIRIQELTNYFLLSVVTCLNEQGYDTKKYDFYISGLWGQEINTRSSTNVHLHKNSQMCGWFFLEAPENCSYPIYYDTRMNKEIIELDFQEDQQITNATNSIHFNNVIPGTVIFANSWIKHQLSANQSEKPTKCIHFIISHKDRLCNTC